MTTTGSDAEHDQAAASRGRLLAAHAALDQAAAGSREYRRGVEAIITATNALLAEQERRLTDDLQRRQRQALGILRLVGGTSAALLVVVLVLASTGVVGGWWWLLALPVLLGVTAVLSLAEPQPGPRFTAGLILLAGCVVLVIASVLRLLPLLLLIPLTVASLLTSVGLLLITAPDTNPREARR